MQDFKYKTSFSSFIKVIVPTEKDKLLAIASLNNLSPIFPDISFSDNPDLLFFAGNSAVAGFINLNDDGISTQTAIQIASKFKYKFVDVEHDRANIVGSIFSYGFTEYGTNRVLNEDEARASENPFNIALGGYVWTVANPQLVDLLVESNNESSPNYGSASFSWEIGFNDYVIALGSKIISEAQIIDDPVEVEKYSKYLRANGGSGRLEDGTPCYRVITGNPIPLGLGITGNPAAAVKGILVASVNTEIENEDTDKSKISNNTEEESLNSEKNEEKEKNNENNEKIISQTEKTIVNKNSTMITIASIEDITDENLKESTAKAVRHFIGEHIANEIDKVSTKYSEELKAKEEAIKLKEEEARKFQEDVKAAEVRLQEIVAELEKEKEARANEKMQADFNARMADLTNSFDLTEKDLEIVAKRIRGLNDEGFAEWLEEFETLASAKKKTSKANEDGKQKTSTASIEEALDKAKANKDTTLPNTTSVNESLMSKFADAFKMEDLISK